MADNNPGTNYDIRTLQLHLLAMLKDVAAAFERHSLRWYMADGTLLGAVREKGFIPWDDDVDLAMPRPDYDRLIAHSREILPEPYEFVCYENDKKYPLHFGKVQDASTTLIERPHLYYLGGVYLDIFPIDGVPDSPLARRLHNLRYQTLRKMLYLRCRDPFRHGRGPSSWVPRLLRRLYTVDKLQAAIRREMTRCPFETSRLVAVNLNDGIPSIVDRELVLGEPTPTGFEDMQAAGMRDNGTYLRQVFGDYMTPPPEGARHIHRFHCLDLHRPYRQYAGAKPGEDRCRKEVQSHPAASTARRSSE